MNQHVTSLSRAPSTNRTVGNRCCIPAPARRPGKPSNVVHAAYFVYAPDLIWDAGINPVPNLS